MEATLRVLVPLFLLIMVLKALDIVLRKSHRRKRQATDSGAAQEPEPVSKCSWLARPLDRPIISSLEKRDAR